VTGDAGGGRGVSARGPARVLAAAVALATLASGPWRAPAGAQAPQDVERGRAVWMATCASCHGVVGGGTAQGPPVIGSGAAAIDFMVSTGRMPLADPARQPERGRPVLDPAEIRAVIAYLASLGLTGPTIPRVAPGAGSLPRGQALFQTNCAACHGAAGAGGSVGGGRVAPSLYRATPLEIAEAIRIGPGAMPPFGEEVLPQADLDAVVRYVLFLQVERDPGGLGLGRSGPVAEGFVGWLVGLGLLVLVARLVGSRT
jgi:ubiquinol-cytochrome c reductase cytochrome c subunit